MPALPLHGLVSICQIETILVTEPQGQLLCIQHIIYFTRINSPGLLEWLFIGMHPLNCSSNNIAVNIWLPSLCVCQKASSLDELKAKREYTETSNLTENPEKFQELRRLKLTKFINRNCSLCLF